MSRNELWSNADGLSVGFGTHSSDNDISSVYGGTRKTVSVEITLLDLSDTFAASDRFPQEIIIPRGSIFIRGYLQTIVAATSGGSATLDIGTWGTGDVVDVADGLAVDVSIAEMTTIGEVFVLDGAMLSSDGTTSAGAVSDSDVVIAPSYETQAFTAGKVRFTVEYLVPAGSTGPAVAAVN